MACRSLRHRGDELLGAVVGGPDVPWLAGIPLLHPWANRLGAFGYEAAGAAVDLTGSPDLYLEEHGLPLHGLRSAVSGWVRSDPAAQRTTATQRMTATPCISATQRIAATRAFVAVPEFPFPHALEVVAELDAAALHITTTLTAGPDRPVPVCFGYHPFFVLPGVPRADWEITLPVAERLVLDDRLVPTGELVAAGALDGPLGTRTFDDGFTAASGPFVLEGGDRRIAVSFDRGYPYAQVFAPPTADVICFEPMTAAADGLRRGAPALAPGASFTARFSVAVSLR